MNDLTKKNITDRLAARLKAKGVDGKPLGQKSFGTQHRISGATINQVLNGKWTLIADKMWQKLSAAVGFHASDWVAAETRDFRAITGYLTVAQADGISLAISFEPGSGKTFALKQYEATHPEVCYLQCADFWSKRYFLQELYRALGQDPGEMTCVELSVSIVEQLRQRHSPLIIIDEVDKLRDTTLMFFIELYNKLNGICGFVLVGAPYLREQVQKCAKRNKRGYREVYSRIGRRFLELKGANRKDVAAVCLANGVQDPEAIAAIWAEVGGEAVVDLRRVEREVQKHHNLNLTEQPPMAIAQ